MTMIPVHRLLWEAARRSPHQVALRDERGVMSYAELSRLADTTAAWLRDHGVRYGDRVLVSASASRTTVAALFGCLRIGAVFVPLSTDMTRYQLSDVIADAQPALVLTDPERQPAVATDRHTSPTPVAADDLALLLYTSGSTARPKAVACTQAQVSFAANTVAACVRYTRDDVVYCRLPLSFDYGLYQIFLTFMTGGTLVLADSSRDARLLSDLDRYRVTVVPIVPSMATMLLKLATRRPTRLEVRLFTNTGEHLSSATADELRRVFPGSGVQLMYGTTECKRITVSDVDDDRVRPDSVGRALPGTTVRILGENGKELPPGEVGEISVRGPHLMAGYWRAPELTARRYRLDEATGERFLLTGDFGHLDAEGHLYFTGRKDDVFKLRGTRISTVEIEAAALSLDGVSEAAVLPPTAERDAMLCVVATSSPRAILSGLRDRLGPAKVPPICQLVGSMPLTAHGKVDRRLLREIVEKAAV